MFTHEAPVFTRRRSSHSRSMDNVNAVKIAGAIFFSSNHGGALGFNDANDKNHKNQVFRVELGGVGSLTEGQFLEPMHVCFLPSSRMNLL